MRSPFIPLITMSALGSHSEAGKLLFKGGHLWRSLLRRGQCTLICLGNDEVKGNGKSGQMFVFVLHFHSGH